MISVYADLQTNAYVIQSFGLNVIEKGKLTEDRSELKCCVTGFRKHHFDSDTT